MNNFNTIFASPSTIHFIQNNYDMQKFATFCNILMMDGMTKRYAVMAYMLYIDGYYRLRVFAKNMFVSTANLYYQPFTRNDQDPEILKDHLNTMIYLLNIVNKQVNYIDGITDSFIKPKDPIFTIKRVFATHIINDWRVTVNIDTEDGIKKVSCVCPRKAKDQYKIIWFIRAYYDTVEPGNEIVAYNIIKEIEQTWRDILRYDE